MRKLLSIIGLPCAIATLFVLATSLLHPQMIIIVGKKAVGGGVLSDVGLVFRYYIDETDDADCSGATAATINDASANSYDLDVVGYGSSTMTFGEVSSNCALVTSDTAGTHHAYHSIDDSSDPVRDLEDASTGTQTITLEFVATVTAFSSSGGRIVVVNSSTSDPVLGVSGSNLTTWRFHWETALAETWSENDEARHVWHVVIDTTQATAADRVKIYQDGSIYASSESSTMAQNDRWNFGNTFELLLLNRGIGSWQRSMTTHLFYAAMYSVAMSAATVSDNYDVLTADDDTP